MSRIFSGVLQMSIAAAWMIPVEMCIRDRGICSLTTGVSLCAGEPVQSDAEAADIVGLFVRKYDRQSGRKCVPG